MAIEDDGPPDYEMAYRAGCKRISELEAGRASLADRVREIVLAVLRADHAEELTEQQIKLAADECARRAAE